jgi:hypothetical protein
VASLLQVFLAQAALVNVANLLAKVHATIERSIANLTAKGLQLLAALKRLFRLATTAHPRHDDLTGWARARMAEQLASVLALLAFLAQVSARVGYVVAIVGRIGQFAAKTKVFIRDFFARRVAGRTTPTPAVCRLGADRPLWDAAKIEDVIALATTPNGLERFDLFTADHTLQLASFDFLNEFFALRTLGGVFRLYRLEVAVHFEVGMGGRLRFLGGIALRWLGHAVFTTIPLLILMVVAVRRWGRVIVAITVGPVVVVLPDGTRMPASVFVSIPGTPVIVRIKSCAAIILTLVVVASVLLPTSLTIVSRIKLIGGGRQIRTSTKILIILEICGPRRPAIAGLLPIGHAVASF